MTGYWNADSDRDWQDQCGMYDEPEEEGEKAMTQRFDPMPSASSFEYQFPRALDAWDWLQDNGFEEVKEGFFRKGVWFGSLRREPDDRGDKEVWLSLSKREAGMTGSMRP